MCCRQDGLALGVFLKIGPVAGGLPEKVVTTFSVRKRDRLDGRPDYRKGCQAFTPVRLRRRDMAQP
ncbi:hypothetical protein KKY_451 [Pelagibacterium halotolerans B2]|uniref:Uncharacterized protein n=1 Tax=Pelagibacterium halotolerans (strain DSM 22347 / JCM 15775 / CGMCC 1.7692 / B2) TaxID=1082931 RepID=G4RAD3_PELHB|nr:hypothetical protein KKY_451 [Pelagibacterium halotolerans B2]